MHQVDIQTGSAYAEQETKMLQNIEKTETPDRFSRKKGEVS